MWDIIGYAGMVLTILAFTLKDVIKLRIVSLIACILWIIYGSHRKDLPLIFVNASVVVIHIYYLIKIKYGNRFTLK